MSLSLSLKTRVGALDIDVDIRAEQTALAIIGPNGSGKTTLLRMIAGAHRPLSGEIIVDGRCFFDAQAGVDVDIEARHVGYVPQGYGLFGHLRVVDNVGFGLPRAHRRERALAMLDELDCAGLAERFPAELSGGEQQRVALARALVVEPSILLLDEPLSAVDTAARRALRELLARRLAASSRPAIVVTHDVRDVVALDASICALDHGTVVQRGSVDDVRAAPANDFIAEFMGALAPP